MLHPLFLYENSSKYINTEEYNTWNMTKADVSPFFSIIDSQGTFMVVSRAVNYF